MDGLYDPGSCELNRSELRCVFISRIRPDREHFEAFMNSKRNTDFLIIFTELKACHFLTLDDP